MIRFSKRRGDRPGLFWPPAPAPKAKRAKPRNRRNGEPGRRTRLGDPPETSSVAVRTLQEELHRAGYDTGRIDGRWGPLTQGAIERFWRSTGLSLELRASANTRLQRVDIATVLWNRLVATPDGAGGEIADSGSRTGSNATRTTTSTRTSSSTTSIGNSTTRRTTEAASESKWWQSPWLWGGVALAAGAGVVLLATQDNKDEEVEGDDAFLLEFEET